MDKFMLSETSVVKLNKNVAVRFEHNFCSGTVFLINVETEKIWQGNKESLLLINELRANKSLKSIKEIYTKIIQEYFEYDVSQVIKALNVLLTNLYENGFLDVIKF